MRIIRKYALNAENKSYIEQKKKYFNLWLSGEGYEYGHRRMNLSEVWEFMDC